MNKSDLIKRPWETLRAHPERVWGRVDRAGDGCWSWLGRLSKHGYGQISVGNAEVLAHRAAYFLAGGRLEPGMCVMHTCDNPKCCNPDHLVAGTHAQNMADMRVKGRRKGINSGEKNGRAKLDPEAAKQIRCRRESGAKLIDLSKQFSVGISTISRVCRMENWK